MKTDRIKILLLASRYKDHSIQTVMRNTAVGLDPERFEVKMCYLRESSHGRGLNPWRWLVPSKLRMIVTLIRTLREERPHILHCHRRTATICAIMATRVVRVPVVITHVHGRERFFRGAYRGSSFRPLSVKRRAETWFMFHWVDKIITVSESIRAECLQNYRWLDPSKVISVKNAIEINQFKSNRSQCHTMKQKMGVSSQDMVYGTVGRLHPDKGHHYLIEAFARVVNKIPNAKLILTGDGPLRGPLQKHAQESGLASKIVFLGHRNDVHELLHGFDVFVFPSVEEPLGLALLEAMASGLPVVASDAGGLPEIFGNGGVGKQVHAGDSISLADAMIELGSLSSSDRWELGNLARKRVEEGFTIKSMCAALQTIYEQSLTACSKLESTDGRNRPVHSTP